MPLAELQPGDVIVVHDAGFWAAAIRFGPTMHNALFHTHEPTQWNHVAVVMPDDAAGNRWIVEGRPGGVGWRDLNSTGYLDNPLTLSNALQPKTLEQREQICATMEALAARHLPYDWPAIAMDTLRQLQPLFAMPDQWGPGVPEHVVCSSGADYVYEKVGLASPRSDRWSTPWDWAAWCEASGWAVAA